MISRQKTRRRCFAIAASFAMAAALLQLAAAQSERDFIFTEGADHLVIRFVGADANNLNDEQRNELINPEFSSMVHDRLQADNSFDGEPLDSAWANAAEPQLESLIGRVPVQFSSMDVSCRSETCRLMLEHQHGREIPAHQEIMAAVQQQLEAFVDENPTRFERVFMLAGYYKEFVTPTVKVYLKRAQ